MSSLPDADAQYLLGSQYATGRGMPQDYVEAHKWLNIAASRASGDLQIHYADARDALAKTLTPEQLAEARKRVREWAEAFELRQKK